MWRRSRRKRNWQVREGTEKNYWKLCIKTAKKEMWSFKFQRENDTIKRQWNWQQVTMCLIFSLPAGDWMRFGCGAATVQYFPACYVTEACNLLPSTLYAKDVNRGWKRQRSSALNDWCVEHFKLHFDQTKSQKKQQAQQRRTQNSGKNAGQNWHTSSWRRQISKQTEISIWEHSSCWQTLQVSQIMRCPAVNVICR